MRVADLMHTDVRTIDADASVAEAVRAMADAHVSGLPVVLRDGRVVGVISTTDVLQAQAEVDDPRARNRLFEDTPVRDLMTRDPFTIAPDEDARAAARHMLYAEVRRLFVVDDGRLVGVVSQTDIAMAVATGKL